jgi:hypothetical protein
VCAGSGAFYPLPSSTQWYGGKNHEKNRKQKARRKAAMALLKEKEKQEGKDNDKLLYSCATSL